MRALKFRTPDGEAKLAEIFRGVNAAAVKRVARVLAHYVERKEINIGDPELAADMFLSLVLGRLPSRRPLRHSRTRGAMEKRVQAAVRVFLEGVRVR